MPRMRLSHVVPVRSAVFDEPNLVSHSGLVPAMGLAARAGLIELADRTLTVPDGPGHAARRDAQVVHRGAGTMDVGHGPAGLPVRACPAAGRGQVPDRPDRADAAAP